MKRNNLLWIIMLFVFSIALVACGGNSSNTSSTVSPNETDSKEEEKGQGSYTIDIGYINATGSETDLGANRFKELIEERTNGDVTVNIFPDSHLGGERDMLEGMKLQTVDVVITGDALFGMFAPEYGGISLPFLVKDTDHLDRVLDGEIGQEIDGVIRETLNSRILDYWHRGPRNLTANKEINSPDGLSGMKLRVPELPLIVEAWKVLGANPTPMAFNELFVALEQGTVDGQENPLDMIYTSKLHEVQTHVMITEHLVAPMIVVMNNDKFESFPEDIQTKIEEAFEEAGTYQKQLVKDNEAEYLKKIVDDGTIIVEEVDRDAFSKKIQESDLEKKFEKEWVPGLIDRIRELE
ncbi:TRAP transporter substrate-binding protein [bacterium LRH843]|nr:TRAP transporter substrate-binding protein [bacterium LRH843]